jgi:hypothetical protein
LSATHLVQEIFLSAETGIRSVEVGIDLMISRLDQMNVALATGLQGLIEAGALGVIMSSRAVRLCNQLAEDPTQ